MTKKPLNEDWINELYGNGAMHDLNYLNQAKLFPEHINYPQEVAFLELNTLYYRQYPAAPFQRNVDWKKLPQNVYQRTGLPDPSVWLSADASAKYIVDMEDRHIEACLRMAANGRLDAFSNTKNVRFWFKIAGDGPIAFSEGTQEVLKDYLTPNNISRKLSSHMYLTRVEGVIDLMRMYQQVVIMQRSYRKWHMLDTRYRNLVVEAIKRGIMKHSGIDYADECFQEPDRYKQLSLGFADQLRATDSDAFPEYPKALPQQDDLSWGEN